MLGIRLPPFYTRCGGISHCLLQLHQIATQTSITSIVLEPPADRRKLCETTVCAVSVVERKKLHFSIELLLYLSLELLVQKHCIITSLLLFWCPYMVINVSVQCNDGLLPDIILLTLYDSIGEPF